MALKDQPYLPLYVQDLLTDEKLIECSASAHGIYLRLLCILHKQKIYGKIYLKQKYKQNTSKYINFALMFAKQMPFDQLTIQKGIKELTDEKVITTNEDVLFQKRMVRDGEISKIRALSGSIGGKKSKK